MLYIQPAQVQISHQGEDSSSSPPTTTITATHSVDETPTAMNQTRIMSSSSMNLNNNNNNNMPEDLKSLSLAPEPQSIAVAPTAAAATTTTTDATINAKRSIEELTQMVKYGKFDPTLLSNEEIIELMLLRQVSVYKLESILGKANAKRCVEIRRQYYIRELEKLDQLSPIPSGSSASQLAVPSSPRAEVLRLPQSVDFDYTRVVGACCENVIGCVRLPVGLVGPLQLDGQPIYVPLATTEGCLVASTSRGMSALTRCGGVTSRITKNSMTRAPIVKFRDIEHKDALAERNRAMDWLEEPANRQKIITAFGSTSKHTQLIDFTVTPSGARELHIRFEARTGDAMGMNMCSKGAEMALKEMQKIFPSMDILTLSGNMCTDKKPSAINWINGRGKSVECSALLPAEVVKKVFKVPVDALIEVWKSKVMDGSALAGSIGGFNCHAANIVSAIFIATGQDAAQVVSSSMCLLTLEKDTHGALAVYCSMPSIECGTVGGGTVLPDQSKYLQLMGIKGSTPSSHRIPQQQQNHNHISSTSSSFNNREARLDGYSNACKLARIICSTVMAAELSLLASLTEGTLVKSHMTHNRSTQPCKVV